MIVAWMLYSLLVAALLAVAAVAAEQAARFAGRPTRWIWLGALFGTLALPLLTRLLRAPGSPGGDAGVPGAVESAASSSLARLATAWWSAATVPAALETPLRFAWIGASVLVLGALIAAYIRLRRELRRWRRERVDDVEVRVSENRGPAAVGFARIEVVLPRWVLACTATERRLILLHEMEHRRAGDSRLLVAALATAVLLPWNPLVWWQLRRLRLATELDCDRRVLQKGADVRAYASLLLNAKLDGLGTRLLTATLFRSKSELGRRIETMTAPQPTHRYLRAVAAAVVGGGILFAACETPTPSAPEAEATAAVEAKTAGEVSLKELEFGTWVERDEALKKIHEVMQTDPERAKEIKALLHDVNGNVFIAEDGTITHPDGDVPLMRTAGADAEIVHLIKEGKLTKEAHLRNQAATWTAEGDDEAVKFGPAD